MELDGRTNRGAPQAALSQYFENVAVFPRITHEEGVALAQAWRQTGDAAAREQLITANLRLVIALAKRYAGRGVSLEELIAEGNVGLIHAVDNFNPDIGCRFSTYAAYWIRHSIAESFASAHSRLRENREQRREILAVEKAAAVFLARRGYAPTITDLAEELGWDEQRVRAARRLTHARTRVHSLADSGVEGISGPSDDAPDGQLELLDDQSQTHHELERLLGGLTPTERRLIELRFGVRTAQAYSLQGLAEITGMTTRGVLESLKGAMSKISRQHAHFLRSCA